MNIKKILPVLGIAALLVSCGGSASSEKENKKVNLSAFPIEWKSPEKPISGKGQTLKRAVVSSAGFSGILNPLLYTDGLDAEFIGPINSGLININEDFEVVPGGLADITVDDKNNEIIYDLIPGLKWSDGEPLTTDDIIYTYEVLGHPDYTGVRYTDDYRLIEGMEDYHNGKVDKISGVIKETPTKLRVKVSKITPAIITGGGGMLGFVIPKHYLENIPVKELENSDRIRLHPLSNGEWVVDQIVPGESIKYKKNPYYYRKNIQTDIDTFIQKILPSSSLITSLGAGEYDLYDSLLADAYPNAKEKDNIIILGTAEPYYSYLGFKLGTWDADKNKIKVNPNAKLKDIRVRKALLHAIDNKTINENFLNGLYFQANGVIPPLFDSFYDPTIGVFEYNPEKANKLLDEAGYKDIDGDGLREDPNGDKFVIYFGSRNSTQTSEIITSAYLQYWNAVGLDVQLYNGRLIDPQNFYSLVKANDSGLDMFLAAWGVGSTIDPANLYSETASFNFPRYSDETNERLIKEYNDPKYVTDIEGRKKAFKKWHEYYLDNVLGFAPLAFRYSLVPINKRVYEYNLRHGSDSAVKMQVVSPKPYVSTK